ncbi:MAG: ATP-binding protein [bacterium]
MPNKIPRRISTAILQSLSAGVVPRIGLEYIAVGRREETAVLLGDLENIAEGASTFRLLIGRFGSGKSFMLQLLRNYAMDRGFVVADADLSPERRLSGANGEGLATYRELMRSLATKTNPDGGALPALLARWVSGIQVRVRQESGLGPESEGFTNQVENAILQTISQMEGMVHGFDFAAVVTAFWRGYRQGDEERRSAAMRWLRGEFTTKTEARNSLGVRVIVDDASWYDTLKIMARFVAAIGYKGLLLLIDEAANLYKISHAVSRATNYERLLAMFNDTMQGKAEHLGILLAGTSQFLEDPRRGLYSYEALRSRLAESRFTAGNQLDGSRQHDSPRQRVLSGPVVRLATLTPEEVFVLLERIQEVYRSHYEQDQDLDRESVRSFLEAIVSRLGAEELLTPREVVRDWIAVLDLLRQNRDLTLPSLLQGESFTGRPAMTPPGSDPLSQGEKAGSGGKAGSDLPEFTL